MDAADPFALFALPRRMTLSRAEIDAAFLRLSRECHPDRFAGAPEEERAGVQRRSAAVNDAYRVLRDPAARAECLLSLEGVARPTGDAKCPADLLAEVFELRESVAEGAPGAKERARALVAEAEARLGSAFARHDAAREPGERRAALGAVREALDRRKFLLRLAQEAEERATR